MYARRGKRSLREVSEKSLYIICLGTRGEDILRIIESGSLGGNGSLKPRDYPFLFCLLYGSFSLLLDYFNPFCTKF